MKKLFPFLLLLISLISCQKKHQDVIEIYLTKERIPHKVGVPFEEIPKYVNIDLTDPVFGRYDHFFVSYDTISKDFVFLGEFDIRRENLKEEPFITNDEILGFDFEKSNVVVSGNSYYKFSDKRIGNLNQFVICINKKPVINGYFLSGMSSAYIDWYAMYYLPYSEKYKDDVIDLYLYFDFRNRSIEIPDFQTTNPEFHQAFQTRNQENNLFQQ
jgi:hypothetical protein